MKRTTLVSGLAAAATGLGTYLAVIRPWHRQWGATPEEVGGAMPLDERIARPNKAVEIKRRAEALAAVRATAGNASVGAA